MRGQSGELAEVPFNVRVISGTEVEANDSIFIGDTTFDMQMAQAAGFRSIGVSWGYHQAEQLLAAGRIASLKPWTS
jgi:phosphoglycolate phosphatase-like HAD superfamily hydrolase